MYSHVYMICVRVTVQQNVYVIYWPRTHPPVLTHMSEYNGELLNCAVSDTRIDIDVSGFVIGFSMHCATSMSIVCMGFICCHKKIPIWNHLVMFCWNLSIENTRGAFRVGQTDRSKKPTLVYLLFWITIAAVVNVNNRFTSTSLLGITQDITLPYCSEHSQDI